MIVLDFIVLNVAVRIWRGEVDNIYKKMEEINLGEIGLTAEMMDEEPKTGHWILTSDDDYEYCTCSECGYQNGENWMIGSQIKYCQECGARMVEPQERSSKE